MSYILPQGYVPDAEFEDSYNERILREREPGMGDPYKGASGGVLDIEGEDLLALDMPGNRHSSSDGERGISIHARVPGVDLDVRLPAGLDQLESRTGRQNKVLERSPYDPNYWGGSGSESTFSGVKATQPEFPIDALDALQQQSKRNLDRMNLRDQPMRPQRALDDPHIFAPYPDERRDTAGPRRRHKDNCDAKPLPALPRSSLSMAAAGSTMTTMHGGHGLSTYSMRQPNSLSMNPDFTPNVYAQPDSSLTGFVPPMSAASLHTRRGTANNLVGSQLDFPGVALKPSRRGIPGPFEHTDPFRGGPYGYNTLSYSDAERGSNPNNFASGSSHYGRSGAFRSNQGY